VGKQKGMEVGKLVSYCWHLVGIGSLLGVLSLSLYRGAQVDRLELEVSDLRLAVGEFKSMVRGLERREEKVERVLSRTRRRVGLSNRRPEVLDFTYGANVPPSTANLTIYDRWGNLGGGNSGTNRHHEVSASWPDGSSGSHDRTSDSTVRDDDPFKPSQENLVRLEQFRKAQEHTKKAQDTHRRSRVAQSAHGGGHGVLIEVDGRFGGRGGQHQVPVTQSTTTHTTTEAPPPSSTAQIVYKRPQLKSLGSSRQDYQKQPSNNITYKRPELKSLGQPDRPSMELTAIQLEAEDSGHKEIPSVKGLHTQWKLARWARHLGSSRKFPVNGGEVGVPTPGLYMVYAQVSYIGKHKHQGFSIRVNNQPEIHCEESRGVGLHISCYSGGLIYLEQGDHVSVVDNVPGQKINTSQGKTFFGMIKLTQDWI